MQLEEIHNDVLGYYLNNLTFILAKTSKKLTFQHPLNRVVHSFVVLDDSFIIYGT